MKNNLVVKILAQCIFFIFGIIVINFILFFVIGISLGGTAELGYADNGNYFLGDHGHYTQVSKAIFQFSIIHTKITFTLLPIGLILAPFVIIFGGLQKPGILKHFFKQ